MRNFKEHSAATQLTNYNHKVYSNSQNSTLISLHRIWKIKLCMVEAFGAGDFKTFLKIGQVQHV